MEICCSLANNTETADHMLSGSLCRVVQNIRICTIVNQLHPFFGHFFVTISDFVGL